MNLVFLLDPVLNMVDRTILISIVLILIAMYIAYRLKDRTKALFGAAYPNARYSAMGNEFITRGGVGRVVGARSLQEALSAASSKDFSFHGDDMDLIDRELDDYLTRVIDMVKDEMPISTSPIFDMFLLRHELFTLKRIIRATYHRNEWEANPVGTLDHKTLQLLKDVDDLNDLQFILRFTSYGPRIAEAFSDGIPDLEELDPILDAYYYEQLHETIEDIKVWKRPYREYLNFYSDIQNIKLVLRIREMGGELEPDVIISSGRGIGEWELQQMAAAETFNESIRHLQATKYEMVSDNIFNAEKELDRKLLKLTLDLAQRYINTAGPSLHFVQSRAMEIQNLRKVFRGISEGIPAADIEKELVLID